MFRAITGYFFGGPEGEGGESPSATSAVNCDTTELNDWLVVNMADQPAANENLVNEEEEMEIIPEVNDVEVVNDADSVQNALTTPLPNTDSMEVLPIDDDMPLSTDETTVLIDDEILPVSEEIGPIDEILPVDVIPNDVETQTSFYQMTKTDEMSPLIPEEDLACGGQEIQPKDEPMEEPVVQKKQSSKKKPIKKAAVMKKEKTTSRANLEDYDDFSKRCYLAIMGVGYPTSEEVDKSIENHFNKDIAAKAEVEKIRAYMRENHPHYRTWPAESLLLFPFPSGTFTPTLINTMVQYKRLMRVYPFQPDNPSVDNGPQIKNAYAEEILEEDARKKEALKENIILAESIKSMSPMGIKSAKQDEIQVQNTLKVLPTINKKKHEKAQKTPKVLTMVNPSKQDKPKVEIPPKTIAETISKTKQDSTKAQSPLKILTVVNNNTKQNNTDAQSPSKIMPMVINENQKKQGLISKAEISPKVLAMIKTKRDSAKDQNANKTKAVKATPAVTCLAVYSNLYINHQHSASINHKTDVLQRIKDLEYEQKSKENIVGKNTTRSKLNRQNRNYIYEASCKKNRRKNFQQRPSGANNNRKGF